MNPTTPLIAGTILITATVSIMADDAADTRLSKQVDELFADWNGTPGVAVGIVQDGKVVHSRGYGLANLEELIPIDSETVFEIGSVTKSFTTACFALLLDDGEVKLDDPVQKYIPEVPRRDPPILVRHLLRCESGLAEYYISLQLAGWNILDSWTREDVLQLIAAQHRFTMQPGERFAYSNADYFLLTEIVRRVTGRSFAEFARRRLFEPIGMNHTLYLDDPTVIVPNRATGYQEIWRTGQFHRFELRGTTVGPFGLRTTLNDMYRWEQNFRENKVSAGPHFNEFLQTGCLIGNRSCLESASATHYRGARRNWYTGGVPGFMAQFVRFPDDALAIIVLTNISEAPRWKKITGNIQRMIDLCLDGQLDPKDSRQPSATIKKNVALSVDQLRHFTGFYRRTNGQQTGFTANVVVRDEQLVFHDHFAGKTPLIAIDANRFVPSEKRGSAEVFEFTSVSNQDRHSLTVRTGPDTTRDYEPITLQNPTADKLTRFEGQYYSDELLTTYHLTVVDGRLMLRVNNRGPEELSPTIDDEFVPTQRPTTDEGRVFRFMRDEDGRVTALHVRLWRHDALLRRVPKSGSL